MKVFCNGDIIEKKELEEIFEPGFLFGWGVFETLRVYKKMVPFLDLHIERLNRNLILLGIKSVDLNFGDLIAKLLNENNLDDAYLRITAYKKRDSTGVIIYVDRLSYYPERAYEKGFSAIISPYRRNTNNYLSNIKSISYLENRLSWYEAQKYNKDEALILNEKNFLIGGSRTNLFIVKNETLITPPLGSGAFCGITRKVLIDELKKLGISLNEKDITIEDLYSSNEAFLSSALVEVMPLVACQDRKINDGKPGSISLKILDHYRKLCSNFKNI